MHGPAGIGKSSLLRELARRARVAAWDVFFVEGRELPPRPDALEAALAGARASPRPLVLIDTYERMTGLDGRLRRDLLPALPGEAVVVVAGRGVPDPAWFDGGWQEVVREIHLTGLGPTEALGLLAAHGVDPARAEAIADWAEGSPLALALAAETATQGRELDSGEGLRTPRGAAIADPPDRGWRARGRATVGARRGVDRAGDDARAVGGGLAGERRSRRL